MIKRITPNTSPDNQPILCETKLTLSSSTQNSLKSKNPFIWQQTKHKKSTTDTSGEIKSGGGGDRIYHATILESPSSLRSRLPDRHNNLHYGCGCGSRSVQKITFELTIKQLMSFDPGEWTESLRKEYILVIEGFITVPLPLFSITYRRAIQCEVADLHASTIRQIPFPPFLLALLAAGDGFSDKEIVDFLVALLVARYETTLPLGLLLSSFSLRPLLLWLSSRCGL
ncbi:hypothetical protein Tsubulata_044349, partial [Turnera subulata]